jgi:hypothetical protein
MEGTMKAVILHGYTNEEAFVVMRAIKALGMDADNTAFATTTPSSLGWKVEYLLEHLAEEHKAMRSRSSK